MIKEDFLKHMETYLDFEDKTYLLSRCFKDLTTGGSIDFDFHCALVLSHLDILSQLINPKYKKEIKEWIEWWLWETMRGKAYLTCTVPELNEGKPFLAKTLDDLWDILQTYGE